MRVLLLAPMAPAPGGGGAIPILLDAELSGLRERHQVTLVTAVGDEAWEAEAIERLTAEKVDLHLADRRLPGSAGARWKRRLRLAARWARGAEPWRTVWFADPGIQAILDRLGAERRFDVVAIQDSSMTVFRLPPAPTVYTHHEVLRPRSAGRPKGRRGPGPAGSSESSTGAAGGNSSAGHGPGSTWSRSSAAAMPRRSPNWRRRRLRDSG